MTDSDPLLGTNRHPLQSGNPTDARGRFAMIATLRMVGAIMAIVGLLVLNGKLLPLDPASTRIIGGTLLVVGLIDFLFVPLWLARRWRTPKDPTQP